MRLKITYKVYTMLLYIMYDNMNEKNMQIKYETNIE